MLRKFLLIFGILATLTPSTASAQMVIPGHINLHNGYIVVRNNVSPKREVSYGVYVPYDPGTPLVQTLLLGIHHGGQTHVPFEGTGYLNGCCYAAGTSYLVKVVGGGNYTSVYVTLRLCNVRGIPFGYAVVDIVGTYIYHHNGISGDRSIHVEDAPCPVDPPR